MCATILGDTIHISLGHYLFYCLYILGTLGQYHINMKR